MIENDNPKHRQLLISKLEENGIFATDYDSGGGVMQVIIPLIDTYSEPPIINSSNTQLNQEIEEYIRRCNSLVVLFIATNSLSSNCEIGLYGTDGCTDNQVSSPKWENVETVDEAVTLMIALWNKRDEFLKKFINGEILERSI